MCKKGLIERKGKLLERPENMDVLQSPCPTQWPTCSSLTEEADQIHYQQGNPFMYLYLQHYPWGVHLVTVYPMVLQVLSVLPSSNKITFQGLMMNTMTIHLHASSNAESFSQTLNSDQNRFYLNFF